METANRITMVSFVFFLFDLFCMFLFIWGVEMTKGSSSAPFCFSSVGFPFWYQGEQVVNISMVAPFHWLLGFHSTPEETPQCISRKKWSVRKSAFLAPKNSFQSWISFVLLFSFLFSRNMRNTTWDFDLISNVIIEKRRRLNSKWK